MLSSAIVFRLVNSLYLESLLLLSCFYILSNALRWLLCIASCSLLNMTNRKKEIERHRRVPKRSIFCIRLFRLILYHTWFHLSWKVHCWVSFIAIHCGTFFVFLKELLSCFTVQFLYHLLIELPGMKNMFVSEFYIISFIFIRNHAAICLPLVWYFFLIFFYWR